MADYDNRASWNVATANHNAHKGDQAAFLRAGQGTLFPEELSLLGKLAGADVVHLQCNAGQDSLSLVQRGAWVTGVDLSDEAVRFATALAHDAGLPATFVREDVITWMNTTPQRFDVAFSSYGTTGWLEDIGAWARGAARVLRPGGRLVYVEFHPIAWTVGDTLRIDRDDYFHKGPYVEPVSDYVADSGAGLLAVEAGATVPNPVQAASWQHGLAEVLHAVAQAGLVIEAVHEWPWANGCRLHPALVMDAARRWHWPEGVARLPLMFGLSARKPLAAGAAG